MLFPFVREREHEADVRERVGLSPEQWYGRTRKPYDTPDTVGSLFLDSEMKRINDKRREDLRNLKRQLKEERSRKQLQRSASEVVLAARGDITPQTSKVQSGMMRSFSTTEISRQRTRLIDALSAMAQREREKAGNSSPSKIVPLPIKMGGTGLGEYSPDARPTAIHQLHPAAQARKEVKQLQRAQSRHAYGFGVDASFFQQ